LRNLRPGQGADGSPVSVSEGYIRLAAVAAAANMCSLKQETDFWEAGFQSCVLG